MPVVMFAVNVSNGSSREFFRSDIFQAAQIYAKDLTNPRDISDAKRAHATAFAEIVLIAHGVEQIFGQL